MISRKKQKIIAKQMFRDSLTNGSTDSEKIRKVLGRAILEKPSGLLNILKIYKRLVETAVAKEQIILETAMALSNKKPLEKELLKKTGARKILYKTSPKITFGAKITHGDWIYDATLDAKLAQLTTDI